MAYVVAEPCIKCKYTDCVEVCPVDCFYEGPNFLVIHPDECIDCGACEPACPTKAIFPEESLPAKWTEYTQLNADLCQDLAEHHREEGRAAGRGRSGRTWRTKRQYPRGRVASDERRRRPAGRSREDVGGDLSGAIAPRARLC